MITSHYYLNDYVLHPDENLDSNGNAVIQIIMPDTTSVFLPHLRNIEPNSQFTFNIPIVTSSAGNGYYAKLGSVAELDQYIGEAESLKAIYDAAPGLAPRVFASGVVEGDSNVATGRPYFLSEYKDMGSLSGKAAELLGERMANELHAFKSSKGYGFHVPTYCGATRQENGWFETWEECYSTMIENLLLQLKGRRGNAELITKGEEVRARYVVTSKGWSSDALIAKSSTLVAPSVEDRTSPPAW